MSRHACRGQRTPCRNQFSPFTYWVPGIKLRLSSWQQASFPAGPSPWLRHPAPHVASRDLNLFLMLPHPEPPALPSCLFFSVFETKFHSAAQSAFTLICNPDCFQTHSQWSSCLRLLNARLQAYYAMPGSLCSLLPSYPSRALVWGQPIATEPSCPLPNLCHVWGMVQQSLIQTHSARKDQP